ncbi:MAG: hypothetical protein KME09_08155 [Pleurocapsa minor HA4230-MV1]|nr:hypothetical protein [Pleurocapsa minor HA4230-MV1]
MNSRLILLTKFAQRGKPPRREASPLGQRNFALFPFSTKLCGASFSPFPSWEAGSL